MQPYLFPYIGYFQLIASCDSFVFLDNVQYIDRGWVNRNYYLINGEKKLFSIPLKKDKQKKYINEREISSYEYIKALKKIYSSILMNYSKSNNFYTIHLLLKKVLIKEEKSISQLAINSILETCLFLGIQTKFILASDLFTNSESSQFSSTERILAIVKKLRGTHYINNNFGRNLYSFEEFKSNGIELFFMEPKVQSYAQNSSEFVSSLSIIDVMMNNSVEQINLMLNAYTYVNENEI